jgi:hypothetical protein
VFPCDFRITESPANAYRGTGMRAWFTRPFIKTLSFAILLPSYSAAAPRDARDCRCVYSGERVAGFYRGLFKEEFSGTAEIVTYLHIIRGLSRRRRQS